MNRALWYFLRSFSVLIAGAFLIFHGINLFDFPKRLSEAPTVFLLIGIMVLFGLSLFLKLPDTPKPLQSRHILLLGLALLLTAPFTFANREFGNSDFAAVHFTFAENSIFQLTEILLTDFSNELAEHIVVLCLGVASFVFLIRHLPIFYPAFYAICLFLIFFSSPFQYMARATQVGSSENQLDIQTIFQPPEVIAPPLEKPNLIILYLESLERTYTYLPTSKDAFLPFLRWEDEGFSARNMQQIHGAHFTAGGLIASQCGVPLLSRGIFDASAIRGSGDENLSQFEKFMPNVICLGDILEEAGYVGSYLNGSDESMFAIDRALKSHGYSNIIGMANDQKWQSDSRRNIWGLDDAVLFEEAEIELERLSQQEKPFFLSLLTVATHGPAGYPDSECKLTKNVPDASPSADLILAIRCTADHVERLIETLQKRQLLQNTVLVIMSDHLAMKNVLANEFANARTDRSNYFTILGARAASANRAVDRPSTTLDAYPTILEAMGFKLKDGAANLGRSLFSTEPNLTEKFGAERLSDLVNTSAALRTLLWASD